MKIITERLYLFTEQTFNTEHSQTISQIYSEDSLEVESVRNRRCGNDKDSGLNSGERLDGSTILASNLTNEQYVSSSDAYYTAEESCNTAHSDAQSELNKVHNEMSQMSLKPDLNKCINLFHNKYMEKEPETNEECSNASTISTKTKVEGVSPCYSNTGKTWKIQYDSSHVHSRVKLSNSLEHMDVSKKEIRKSKSCTMLNSNSKRDTNHNIKANQFCLASTETTVKADNHETTVKADSYEKVETIVPSVDALSLSECIISSSNKDNPQSMEEDQKYASTSGESTIEDIDPCDLKTLLYSLENKQKSPQKEAPAERMLRRLSTLFYVSPCDFTEKLLTIIEESVVTNDSDARDFPDVSLRRLTAEIRKMCKFIDDETMPEWPTSPGMSTLNCTGERRSISDYARRSLGISSSPSKRLYTPPTVSTSRYNGKSPRKTFRRTPKTISAVLDNVRMYESPNMYDSTSTFERLEAYCKGLYPDEYRSQQQKNCLQSPLRNMNTILHVCNAQMESLEDSLIVREPVQNVATSSSDQVSRHDPVPETQNLHPSEKQELMILTPDKRKESLLKDASSKQRAGRSTRCEMIEPDELEKTLMYEIAKKRQRCLETAKVIMEIDGTSEPLRKEETCSISSANKTKLSTEKDAKLMNTLISCKKYQEYLEESKPLLSLLQRSKSCKPSSAQSTKNVPRKEINKVNVATLAVPSSLAMTAKKSKCSSPKTPVVPKPRLFVTPGRTPFNKNTCKGKRTYFRNLGVSPNKQENLKKASTSPRTPNIYRKLGIDYGSVMSPVGIYIKGTNPHLIKNLRPKTNEMLLTPRRKQTTPSANIKSEIKFRLSPKQPTKVSYYVVIHMMLINAYVGVFFIRFSTIHFRLFQTLADTAAGNENVPDNFLHPKVHYKLPSHTRTVCTPGNFNLQHNNIMHNKVLLRDKFSADQGNGKSKSR